jgi:hypothetical protein
MLPYQIAVPGGAGRILDSHSGEVMRSRPASLRRRGKVLAAWILVGIRGRNLARGGGWVACVREVWRGVLCTIMMVWVGAVVRVVEPLVVVVGCFTERVLGRVVLGSVGHRRLAWQCNMHTMVVPLHRVGAGLTHMGGV